MKYLGQANDSAISSKIPKLMKKDMAKAMKKKRIKTEAVFIRMAIENELRRIDELGL